MPLAAQRRHVIASLHHPFPAILLYQHLLCPSVVLLVIRSFVQTRIATPRKSHPEATLRILALFVLGLNMFATFIHVLDLAEGTMPGKSLLVDFVGLKTPPSHALVLGLDAFITVYQLVTLYIGYLSFPVPNATSQGFPVDPLLPPNQSWGAHELHAAAAKEVIFENQDDEESQIANARKQDAGARVQSSSTERARSDSRDDSLLQDQDEDGYDVYTEEDDLLRRTDPDGDVSDAIYQSYRSSSLEGAYTVVHIPILFMLKTILTYPRQSSISSLEPSTTAETIPTAGSGSTSTTTDDTGTPQRPRRTSAAPLSDLRIQALTGLNPGLLNAIAREHAGGNDSTEQDDSRAEYRRMPGGYSGPSL